MLTVIQHTQAIARAQDALATAIQNAATSEGQVSLGWQGGGADCTICYNRRFNFWVALEDAENRFWNAFGLGNPFYDDHTIITEINPPKSGIDRRISGAFVQDEAGRIHLAHRGRIGGGRKGIGKKAFLNWYPEEVVTVRDGDRLTPMIVLSAVDSAELIEKLANFTRRVSEFKSQAVCA